MRTTTPRAVVSPRSMVALWMVGLEDSPERCAEICITEMFGRSVVPGESVEVGMGLHSFRDPSALWCGDSWVCYRPGVIMRLSSWWPVD